MSDLAKPHDSTLTPGAPRPDLAPIAIIGMACIFPDAPDLQAFWNNILNGVDAVGDPVENWDAQRYLDAGRIKTPKGGWLKDLYRFDPREFGIMPNSMDGGEPDHFLALRVARDALADAGYHRPDADHRDTGIILGHSTYLHRGQVTVIQNNIVLDQTIELMRAALPHITDAEAAELRKTLQAKLPPTNSDTAPGLVPNVMTGRIANRLNFKGPNYLVDAACSSSLLAISAAMDELRAGRSRLMLAGGVNASLPADVSTIFTQLGALSARGKVRPFEGGSDGTLLGEGLGIVTLKRLDDALADGDRVYAVLRGVGQASDGRGTGLLAPSVEGETLSIRRAYDTTGVDPATVSLIEAHGTGIPLGDKTEIAALTNVFGTRSEGGLGSIAIGSVKSMISHCIPAAGSAGLIKTALALHHRVLPPTLCENVNPELGLDRSRLYVNTEAKPWIAPPGQPRRAGVDSFGFGGINTHAIVEQAPPQARRPALLSRWPFELCVLAAADAAALATQVETLQAALQRNPGWALDEIAAALAAQLPTGEGAATARLALVVKSREALAKGLASALPKLREGKTLRWTTSAGAFFSSEAQTGQLAFIFPGEGSQYLGMFADLAQHFEEVREWLDFWRGLYADEPGATRTDIAFPPLTELTPERRKALEARLHDMDVGSEAVMVGGQAMFALLQALGVQPDVMLGHSSGESSALAASGALPKDPLKLADFIRQMNAVYQQVLAEGKIPTGALLAVGALPATMVHEAVAASGEKLDVAMDNCANQAVLYGQKAAIEAVQARLVAVGGICMALPFDRGYHTPDFGEVSSAFHGYYKAIKLAAPQVPLYSCASTQRFPEQVTAVRKLAAAQWSATVRFRETVQNMVADGVRCFVEVGPSGNLTAFVDDILADQPHVALATNLRRKHGLEQLLGTLGQLWTLGRPVDLGALFSRRRIAVLNLQQDQVVPRLPGLLDNTLPSLRLNDADRALLQRLGQGPAGGAPAAAQPVQPPVAEAPVAAAAPIAPPAPTDVGAQQPAPDLSAEATGDPALAAVQAQVMGEYFDMMRGFLAQQQQVVAGWQAAPVADEAAFVEADTAAPAAVALPLLHQVLQQDGQSLRALCRLSVAQQAFLRDHVLSGRGSDTDPELWGLACVPLMVSLEIMAQAAVRLAPGLALTVVEQVRAFDWIALDQGELALEVQAQLQAGPVPRVRVSLWQLGAKAVEAEFLFGAPLQLPALPALGEAQAARWDGAEIYDIGMFHGPIFQSLAHIQGWNGGGLDCELSPCSLAGFLEEGQTPWLVLNPVLLDAMGQLAACWVAEHVGTDFNCFPSSIERLELWQPLPAWAPGVVLRGRQHAVDPAAAADVASPRSWAFEAVDAQGQPLVRVQGWVNVFFHVPHRFYQVRRSPLQGWLGGPLDSDLPALLWQVEPLPEAFCAQSRGIFLRMLAHAVLSFEERQDWLALKGSLKHRRQWLMGRMALKEAVRYWAYQHSGELLYPSDVVVQHDALGAPSVGGWWVDHVVPLPAVSLTHDAQTCTAALSLDGLPVGVDREDLQRLRRPEALERAFTEAERAWWLAQPEAQRAAAALRLRCCKEAASKLLGRGLQGRPEAFEVHWDPASEGTALVHCGDSMVQVELRLFGNTLLALAAGQPLAVQVQP